MKEAVAPSIYSNNGLLKQHHGGTPFKNSSLLVLVLILSLFCHTVNAFQSSKPAVPVKATAQMILTRIRTTCLLQDSRMSTVDTGKAAFDYGNITHYDPPLAVVYPSSVSQISCILKLVYYATKRAAGVSSLKVAARGNGHSTRGQAQAQSGLVIYMNSLSAQQPIRVFVENGRPYVDAGGGHSWAKVLNETLKFGLSPKSLTEYLGLTVGGTLSNAGISGQTFRQGPQITNVDQLEVVTGKGEVFNCSENENPDLFYGALGGLGQFGIITRAKIPLAPPPKMVKHIEVIYSDFATFSKDQEHLVSLKVDDSLDYVRGSAVINKTQQSNTAYSIEAAKYFNPEDRANTDEVIRCLLSALKYNQATLNVTELSYFEFLNRARTYELAQRAVGLWDVPHPWLNLFVPRSKMQAFADEVFGKIIQDSSSGPILIFTMNKSKWNARMSAVIPDEAVFYGVSKLFAAAEPSALAQILAQNQRILNFSDTARLGVKQYLAYHQTMAEWKVHFGSSWNNFQKLKTTYDPSAILAPGQRIFTQNTYTA